MITGKGEAEPDYRYVLMPIRSAAEGVISKACT